MSTKVYFRVDSSLEIGTGHIVRCTTLAKRLLEHGAECHFICRNHDGNRVDHLRCAGFTVAVLPLQPNCNNAACHSKLAHAAWLGTDWATDARQTIDALQGVKPDWLVVDHYALDARWEARLRPYVTKILTIDDLADRPHDCDVLLDQNMVADMDSRYQGLVPPACTMLLGPHYALLQPEYGELKPRTPPRVGRVRRILIFFGGVDKHNMTNAALAAFKELHRSDILVDVVLSPTSPHATSVRAEIRGNDNIRLHESVPSLAPLMVQADVALGAGGVTSWERCCLGLPSVVVTIADNQTHIADELHRQDLARWLGHYNQVTHESLKNALLDVINAPDVEAWSRRCANVLDGRGTQRVATIVALHSETPLHCRLAQVSDEALLLRWANDPVVRAHSFTPTLITAEEHRRWFYNRLRRHDQCRIYIVETEQGLPVGQVRFDSTQNGLEIDYSVDKMARGFGLGAKVLWCALVQLGHAIKNATVVGRVKVDNVPSQAVFKRLQFTAARENDHFVYRLNVGEGTGAMSKN